MQWTFLTNEDPREHWKCSICRTKVDEGYRLTADSQLAWDTLEGVFGDDYNWFVGECCFGGYCHRPNVFFEQVLKKMRARQ
ncbi:MAG: hypothetical protein ACE5J2_07970 [Nitrososphaerales archaeon]